MDTPKGSETAIKAALSLVPYAGGALSTLYADVVERRRSRVQMLAQRAFYSYPGTNEEFVEQLRSHDRLTELFGVAVEAASRSARYDKIAALSQLLAEAVTAEEMHPSD